ncbi:MAG TPA: J domain-containing protein [Candidatus Limnocylindrales bacterium]|nr:J domain-containing protein [Candidatus Limnocylindrales bacterium]
MDYQDYYQTLGVPRTATQAEIKKAFRKLARENHPDANAGDAASEKRFKQINEAHAVLSDPEKRKKYDMLGANWEQLSRAGAGAGPGANPFAGFGRSGGGGNVRYEFHTTGGGAGEFSDFFRMFFSEGSPLGEDAPGGGGSGRGRRPTGGPTFEDILRDMGIDGAAVGRGDAPRPSGARGGRPASAPATAEAVAEITLEEAFHGTTRRIDVQGKRLEVTIPRGADSGTRIKLSGQGPGGGDLVVVVRVRPHPIFNRRGADLERDLPVTLGEALLGAEVPVTTLKGKGVLKIPAGTQSGRIFRLKGQGMPILRKDDVGDLLAKVRVVLPTELSQEAEAAAKAFLDLADQPDPR